MDRRRRRRRRKRTAHIPISSKEEVSEETQEPEWRFRPSQYILNLPHHLTMDILSRLPIKTLLSCRCVCKTWQNLVSDPEFAKLHVERSPVCLLLRSDTHPRVESRVLNLVDRQGGNTANHDAKLMLTAAGGKLPDIKFPLVNSINGLLCLCEPHTRDPIYICNPILGEYITIPKTQNFWTRGYGVGFGLCHETNQYKVIRVLRGITSRSHTGVYSADEHYEGEIYTLGERTWRNIGNVPYHMPSSFQINSYLNGALHWVNWGHQNPDFIHSFHFGSEQFQAIPAPAHFGQKEKSSFGFIRIGVLAGCLCLCDCTHSADIYLWIMKDYGVKDSWTKDFVIRTYSLNKSGILDISYPILILGGGEILMLFDNNGLVLYNTDTECFRYPEIFGITSGFRALIALVPSFVSLRDVAKGEKVKVCRA